jgi:hypothetical protein
LINIKNSLSAKGFLCNIFFIEGVEKDHFNRKALKVVAKDTMLKHCKSVLCDLGEKP